MTTIINATTIDGEATELIVNDGLTETLDAQGLTVMPAGIDLHVHFRTPGETHKEDWHTAAQACIHGGYTMVFDMPNNIPSCVTKERLLEKQEIINSQLSEIPLRYELYIGANKHHFDEIPRVKDLVPGIKVFMGSSTGDLLMDDDESLEQIFAVAQENDMSILVHAESECMLQDRYEQYKNATNFSVHSVIRSPEVAEAAVKQAIALAKKYKVHLHILHVSTINELKLIKQAKKQGLRVTAEACPHHLFLNVNDYPKLGAKLQMNPPVRSPKHQQALWDAIHDGTIDTLGSDHAPHTLEEKAKPFGQAPSGVPNMETSLALLFNAFAEKRLSLQEIEKLTSVRAKEIFNITDNNDIILVDLNKKQTVENHSLKTKCGWSPYEGMELQGWPVYTILRDKLYKL